MSGNARAGIPFSSLERRSSLSVWKKGEEGGKVVCAHYSFIFMEARGEGGGGGGGRVQQNAGFKDQTRASESEYVLSWRRICCLVVTVSF